MKALNKTKTNHSHGGLIPCDTCLCENESWWTLMTHNSCSVKQSEILCLGVFALSGCNPDNLCKQLLEGCCTEHVSGQPQIKTKP